MGYDFQFEDEPYVVHPVYEQDRVRLKIDGQIVEADLLPTAEEGAYRLDVEGREETVFVATQGDVHFVHLRGRTHRVAAVNALERARRDATPSGGAHVLRAPMPGTVVAILVSEGDEIDPGAHLMTIESMKLETAINASQFARVSEICVAPGQNFDQGDALVRLSGDGNEGEVSK